MANKRTECLPVETGDMSAILDLCITSLEKRRGRPAEYPETPAGLADFTEKSLDYFRYVNKVNADPDEKKKLIPDIENWSLFLGVSRQTVFTYERRGGEWKAIIGQFKNAIAAVKKEMAMTYKVPPMLAIFDFVNNHNYMNTNRVELVPEVPEETQKQKQQRLELEQRIIDSNLVWDETAGEFVPAERGATNDI